MQVSYYFDDLDMRIFCKEHDGEDADEDAAMATMQLTFLQSLEPQESVFYSADSDSEHDSDSGDLMNASIYRPKTTKKPATVTISTSKVSGMLSRSNSIDESPAAPFAGGWNVFLFLFFVFFCKKTKNVFLTANSIRQRCFQVKLKHHYWRMHLQTRRRRTMTAASVVVQLTGQS